MRRKNFGLTAVYKLLARKRPHLLPVYDTYIGHQLKTTPVSFYRNLRSVLRYDDHALEKHLATIQQEVPEAAHLSILRVFDIIVWWAEEQRRRSG